MATYAPNMLVALFLFVPAAGPAWCRESESEKEGGTKTYAPDHVGGPLPLFDGRIRLLPIKHILEE